MIAMTGLCIWARHRRVARLAVVELICVVLVALTGGIHIGLPSLFLSGSLVVPNAAVIPLMGAVAYAAGLAGQDTLLEPGTRLWVWWGDVAVAIGMAAGYLLPALVVAPHMPIVACRNALGLCGLVLLGHGIGLVRAAGLFPVVWTIAALLAGDVAASSQQWSWPIKRAGDELGALQAGLLFLLAALLYLTRQTWRLGRWRPEHDT